MIEFSFNIQKKNIYKNKKRKWGNERTTDRPSQGTTSLNVLSAPLALSFSPSPSVNELMTIREKNSV